MGDCSQNMKDKSYHTAYYGSKSQSDFWAITVCGSNWEN